MRTKKKVYDFSLTTTVRYNVTSDSVPFQAGPTDLTESLAYLMCVSFHFICRSWHHLYVKTQVEGGGGKGLQFLEKKHTPGSKSSMPEIAIFFSGCMMERALARDDTNVMFVWVVAVGSSTKRRRAKISSVFVPVGAPRTCRQRSNPRAAIWQKNG
jgi:hypothetical protein